MVSVLLLSGLGTGKLRIIRVCHSYDRRIVQLSAWSSCVTDAELSLQLELPCNFFFRFPAPYCRRGRRGGAVSPGCLCIILPSAFSLVLFLRSLLTVVVFGHV